MVKKIFLVLFAIVLVLVIVVASRPADFRYQRSTTIAAPPAAVFPHVNDLHLWQIWSPYAKKDAAAKYTFQGPPAGPGAAMGWAGNNDVGVGTMTVVESKPDELVRFRLDFKKPFEGSSFAEFTFKPDGNQTLVTWSMSGKNSFVFKAVSMVMDCDKMIGGDFDKGLADLKAIVEAESKKPATP